MATAGKVQLKLPPWVAIMLNEQSSGWFILEKEIGEGATIGELLEGLALNSSNLSQLKNYMQKQGSEQVKVIYEFCGFAGSFNNREWGMGSKIS